MSHVTDQILSTFTSIFLAIDENFNSLRTRIQDLETNFIATLRNELKEAKEAQIKESEEQIMQVFANVKMLVTSHNHSLLINCNMEAIEAKLLQ